MNAPEVIIAVVTIAGLMLGALLPAAPLAWSLKRSSKALEVHRLRKAHLRRLQQEVLENFLPDGQDVTFILGGTDEYRALRDLVGRDRQMIPSAVAFKEKSYEYGPQPRRKYERREREAFPYAVVGISAATAQPPVEFVQKLHDQFIEWKRENKIDEFAPVRAERSHNGITYTYVMQHAAHRGFIVKLGKSNNAGARASTLGEANAIKLLWHTADVTEAYVHEVFKRYRVKPDDLPPDVGHGGRTEWFYYRDEVRDWVDHGRLPDGRVVHRIG
jgi:hypothetical protein